ncbi:MAG: S8 family peptidase [Nocardioidaceae bacterium]
MRPRRAPRRLLAPAALAAAALLTPRPATALPAATPATAVAPKAHGHHLDAWWYDLMHLDRVHRRVDGSGARVAVVDGAIDTSIPELRGADVHVHRGGCRFSPSHAVHGEVTDHGTSMAALLVGTGHGNAPGGLGIEGVAPGARLDFYSLSKDRKFGVLSCNTDEVGRTIVEAARDGADIISVSIGGEGVSITPYVRTAMRLGAVVVASMGDTSDTRTQGRMDYPAAVRGVVGVDAGSRTGKPWKYNPVPRRVDFRIGDGYPAATSFGIDLTVPRYVEGRGWVSDSTGTGTSGATAIVAGQLALVKSRWPEATGNQLIQQLVHYSADDVPFRWDRYFGYGYPSTTKMLAHDPTLWPDENPLLLLPKQAHKRYPMSVRAAAHTAAPSAEVTPVSAASSTGASAGTSRGAVDAQDGSSAQGGVPVVAWAAPAAVLAALVLGGLGFVLRRRGLRERTTGAVRDEERQGAMR